MVLILVSSTLIEFIKCQRVVWDDFQQRMVLKVGNNFFVRNAKCKNVHVGERGMFHSTKYHISRNKW